MNPDRNDDQPRALDDIIIIPEADRYGPSSEKDEDLPLRPSKQKKHNKFKPTSIEMRPTKKKQRKTDFDSIINN